MKLNQIAFWSSLAGYVVGVITVGVAQMIFQTKTLEKQPDIGPTITQIAEARRSFEISNARLQTVDKEMKAMIEDLRAYNATNH